MRRSWDSHEMQHLHDEVDRASREVQHLEEASHRWRHKLRHQEAEVRRAADDAVDELHRLRHHHSDGTGHGGASGLRDEDVAPYATAAAGAVAALLGIVLATGHLSALLFDGGWPRYELGDIPDLLLELVGNLGDPAAAWRSVSAPGSPTPPAAGLWWATFLVLVAALGVPAWLAYKAGWFGPGDRSQEGWATPADLRDLRVRRTGDCLVAGGLQRRTIGMRDSLLVTGATHAGKTSGVAIPAVLGWTGPLVVASTDPRLVSQTIGWRSTGGRVQVFDPAAAMSFPRSGWNPLHGCGRWPGAVRTAQLINAAVGGAAGDVEGLSRNTMALALAPFLHAAAVDRRSVVQVAEWLGRDERDEVTTILRRHDPEAAAVHEASHGRDDEIRRHFLRLMFDVFSVYLDPVVAKSAWRHDVDADDFLDGGTHTLYLTAPGTDLVRFTPLFATIVRQILARADEAYVATGTPVTPRLLVVFDEAVGVISADDFAALVASTPAERGVQFLTVMETAGAPSIARAHRAHLVLPGGADPTAPKVLARLQPGEAALLTDGRLPARLRLPRWWEDRVLRRRAETPRTALPSSVESAGPPARPDTAGTTSTVALQAGSWQNRRGPADRDDTLTGHGNDDPTIV